MTYSYRADGAKIKKTHHYFAGRSRADAFGITEYIDGFQYNNEEFGLTGESLLKFFSTSEGYFDYQNNRYIYHYNDHLGNVRISFAREGNTAIIVEQNDYYAFGLKHGGSTIDLSGVNYKYQYNGKEFQDKIGMYDYGARFYMPDLGRWGVVDPLAEISRRFSPYVYGNNNPVRFTDPDGRSSLDGIKDSMPNIYSGWENTPGVNFGDWNNFSSPSQFNAYIDAGGSGGGGGSYATFGQTPAYRALMSGQTSSITNSNGYLNWNILDNANVTNGSIGGMTAHSVKVGDNDKGYFSDVWNSPLVRLLVSDSYSFGLSSNIASIFGVGNNALYFTILTRGK